MTRKWLFCSILLLIARTLSFSVVLWDDLLAGQVFSPSPVYLFLSNLGWSFGRTQLALCQSVSPSLADTHCLSNVNSVLYLRTSSNLYFLPDCHWRVMVIRHSESPSEISLLTSLLGNLLVLGQPNLLSQKDYLPGILS